MVQEYILHLQTEKLHDCVSNCYKLEAEKKLSLIELKMCFDESEVMLEENPNISHLYAFATCSYETWNSRTVVYAKPCLHPANG